MVRGEAALASLPLSHGSAAQWGARLDWPVGALGSWVAVLGGFNVICVHVTERDLVLCLLPSLFSLCVCVCVYKCYTCMRE